MEKETNEEVIIEDVNDTRILVNYLGRKCILTPDDVAGIGIGNYYDYNYLISSNEYKKVDLFSNFIVSVENKNKYLVYNNININKLVDESSSYLYKYVELVNKVLKSINKKNIYNQEVYYSRGYPLIICYVPVRYDNETDRCFIFGMVAGRIDFEV